MTIIEQVEKIKDMADKLVIDAENLRKDSMSIIMNWGRLQYPDDHDCHLIPNFGEGHCDHPSHQKIYQS